MREHEMPVDGPAPFKADKIVLMDADGRLGDEIDEVKRDRWEQSGYIELYNRDYHEATEYWIVTKQ